MSRRYQGTRRGSDPVVTVDSAPLNPRTDIRNHGPGLNWGYGGSGAAQLALALLADHLDHHPTDVALLLEIAGLPEKCDVCGGAGKITEGFYPEGGGDDDPCWNCQGEDGERHLHRLIERVHQRFKERVVAKMPEAGWWMESKDVHVELVELASEARAQRGATAAPRPVRVIVSRTDQPPVVEMVATDLATLQRLVDGPIQILFLRPNPSEVETGLCLVVNEEGRPRRLPRNHGFGALDLCGTIVVTRIVGGVHVDLDPDHAAGFLAKLQEQAAAEKARLRRLN